jgi:hypothetical protein
VPNVVVATTVSGGDVFPDGRGGAEACSSTERGGANVPAELQACSRPDARDRPERQSGTSARRAPGLGVENRIDALEVVMPKTCRRELKGAEINYLFRGIDEPQPQ